MFSRWAEYEYECDDRLCHSGDEVNRRVMFVCRRLLMVVMGMYITAAA